MQGIPDGVAAPLWLLETAGATSGPRPSAHTAVAARATVALGAGHQNPALAAPRAEAPAGGLRHAGGAPSRAGPPGLADHHARCGAAHPRPPSAGGRRGASGEHARPGRGRRAPTPGLVPPVRPLLLAPGLPASAAAAAGSHPGHGRRPVVAALATRAGGGADGPWRARARRAALPRAAGAAARGGCAGRGGGSRTGRGPEPATCGHTASVEGVPRGARAARRPWGASLPDLFVPMKVGR